jgi:hypothetical protein
VSQLLNNASSQIPENFLPLTFQKASAIQKSMEQEAFVLLSIEQLLEKHHYHLNEVQALLDKAQKINILHPLIDQVSILSLSYSILFFFFISASKYSTTIKIRTSSDFRN